MRIKYIGARDIFPVTMGPKRYIFDTRNNYEMVIPDKDANYILQMSSGQFRVLPEVEKESIKITSTMTEVTSTAKKTVSTKMSPQKKKRRRPRKNDN